MKSFGSALLFVALMTSSAAHAQVAIEGGINLANMSITSAGTSIQSKFLARGTVGLLADIGLNQHVYFEPGVFLQGGGATLISPVAGQYIFSTTTVHLDLEYKTGEKCGNRFLLGVGPYFAKINSGEYAYTSTKTIMGSAGELVIGSGDGANMKSLDMGLALNAGYLKAKHLYIRFRYQLGVANLVPGGDDKNSIKTSGIIITGGVLFGGGCRERKSRSGSGIGNHWRGLSKGRYSRRVSIRRDSFLKY
jgi:Outer membrane protein beta-barrel domain